ncbi:MULTISPECIES: sugar ABC transporter ATP-binding protein [unclassified Modicisalibacter]|uniref:sugar ABC transporter ATP-binding protein n=1 Tax=unclassified Modicisalibacter TaxID=2679913 RepID=UPI001CCCD644|nr:MULTISPECIES: sugar ABC transporter ATP-binding protein [unclassified Modicisalibacter]MBZ9559662.1 sugar ABC transporter ATP-binding protein [Modicisalibacter sp. R2A 31.J]MBZ9577114.1 sugar ABC transporter ATP-binding protein [Modicisalibacter sp. MOD 31.J]
MHTPIHSQPGDTDPGPWLLRLEHVSKRFGGVQALDDIAFNVRPGEVLCLAGENGCGKSTLIKTVSGVHAPEPGAVMQWDGQDMLGIDPARARELGIQVIWQDLALFPEMSVAENIAFERNLGRRPRLVKTAAMRAQAAEILDSLGVNIDLDARVASLSIANRQLVAIARALIANARLVFMDEPTASLSRHETEALIDIVRRLSAQGIAVVFVSHRLAEVLDICSRVTVLRDGCYVGTYSTEGMTQSRLTELMTGRQFDYRTRPAPTGDGEPRLSVRGLTRQGEYRDIDLDIRPGEIVGLTGRLGAGRTELALSLFGMRRPERGQILLDGRPLRMTSNRDAIRAGIAYVSEDRLSLGLVQQQAIADNIAITVLGRLLNRAGLLSPRRQTGLVADWIRRLKVKVGSPQDPVSSLSGGNQQRIVLAKWLATEPRLLILDSPTVGVDVGARAGIFEIVAELAAQGMAILLISDETPEVYFNADRVLHMRDGRLVESFIPAHTELERIEEAIHA